MKRAIIILAVLLVAAGILGGWWIVAGQPRIVGADSLASGLGLGPRQQQAELAASGFIEADEATVASDIGGRIVSLRADEGDQVSSGQTLVELDTAILAAQIKQSEADLAAAEAALAKVKAGVRPETISSAQAVVEQAQAAQEAARVGWEDAEAMVKNPQQLDLAIVAAQNQLGVLDFQTRQAEAIANAAQAGRDLADTAVEVLQGFEPYNEWVLVGSYDFENLPIDLPSLPNDQEGEFRWRRYRVVVQDGTVELWYLAPIRLPDDALTKAQYEQATATYQSWQAWTGLAQTQAAQQGTENYLGQLAAQKATPLTLQAKADAAQSQYEVATAAVGVAQAQVEGLRMGATPEQVAAAQAQVDVARAALGALKSQQSRFTIQAPITGLVLDRSVHAGEVAAAGVPLMTLADLDNLTLTVYVPEGDLGRLRIGQEASITVDAYPGRVFTGTVSLIGSQAEYTPKNVQTREDRVSLVFAVKIRLSNLDHALKPGMPADAVLAR